MKNLKKKQEEITKQFEKIQKEVQQLEQIMAEKQAELLKLQGAHRLLEELQKDNK